MRSLFITIGLFIVLLTCIWINSSYINTVYDKMIDFADDLSSAPCFENESLILEAKKYWESQNTLIELSLNYRDIIEVSNSIDAILAANNSNNDSELQINIKKFKNAVKSIIRLEKIEISNIF